MSPAKSEECAILLAARERSATLPAVLTPRLLNFVNRFFPSEATSWMSPMCVTALKISLPTRAARAAPVSAFSPAAAPAPAPAVATAIITSGIRCPMARAGSSAHVSQSRTALPSASKNAPGSCQRAFAKPTTVSTGIVTCLAKNSSTVMSPTSMRPKSNRKAIPFSFKPSFTRSMTASTKPTTTEPTARATESNQVRSGSMAMPVLRAEIRAAPASLTLVTSVLKSVCAPDMALWPGPSSQ